MLIYRYGIDIAVDFLSVDNVMKGGLSLALIVLGILLRNASSSEGLQD